MKTAHRKTEAPAVATELPPIGLVNLDIPVRAELEQPARDLLKVCKSFDPSLISRSGIFMDAWAPPSFAPELLKSHVELLERHRRELTQMPWRGWTPDEQIDHRWLIANIDLVLRQLTVEKRFEYRPACWLEPFLGTLLDFARLAPAHPELKAAMVEELPGMLQEIDRICLEPTSFDLQNALQIADALRELLGRWRHQDARLSRAVERALPALGEWRSRWSQRRGTQPYRLLGADNFSWRFHHEMLRSDSPREFLSSCERELQQTEKRLAALKEARPATPSAGPGLTRERYLAGYDAIQKANLACVQSKGEITLGSLGALKAREVPFELEGLLGQGGSVDPPAAAFPDRTGWWNVARFRGDWDARRKEAVEWQLSQPGPSGLGVIAAHEGIPGHFLQISLSQELNNPIRVLLSDPSFHEGWALYAEGWLWRQGGLGPGPEAERSVLLSLRRRLIRAILEVRLQLGDWDLQAAERYRKESAKLDPSPTESEIELRVLDWPTQMCSYASGYQQIQELRRDCQEKWGEKWSPKRFHDEMLRQGSIPVRLIRCKLLGESVPDE